MKHFSALILGVAMMTGCATDADEPAKAETADEVQVGCNQQVQLGTFYFSDRAETNWVGQCLVTCAQWVNGAEPFPGQGATCSGTTPTAYHAPYIGTCHACRF